MHEPRPQRPSRPTRPFAGSYQKVFSNGGTLVEKVTEVSKVPDVSTLGVLTRGAEPTDRGHRGGEHDVCRSRTVTWKIGLTPEERRSFSHVPR